MNAKRCKRIRRALSGLPLSQLEMKYTTILEIVGMKERTVPLTFKYPENSYQRVYRDVKRVS